MSEPARRHAGLLTQTRRPRRPGGRPSDGSSGHATEALEAVNHVARSYTSLLRIATWDFHSKIRNFLHVVSAFLVFRPVVQDPKVQKRPALDQIAHRDDSNLVSAPASWIRKGDLFAG